VIVFYSHFVLRVDYSYNKILRNYGKAFTLTVAENEGITS
jgi:hypothetical protein